MAGRTTTTTNERFWSSQMISFISQFVRDKTWSIKSAGGETTINTGSSVMFPDILLYGDEAQGVILQGWEVKMPDVSITDVKFVTDAERKARILGLNSFILWNFTYCKLFIKDQHDFFREIKLWDSTNYISDRPAVALHRTGWETLLKQVLFDINAYLDSGVLVPRNLDFAISEIIMPELIKRNKTLIADHLVASATTNITIKSYIEMWWDEVKNEYMSDESNMYSAYAKTILVDWLNKFVFAHIIKRYHNPASEIENIKIGNSPIDARSVFRNISNQCDFWNIFKDFKYGDFIPNQCWSELLEFNTFLSDNYMENISQTTLQSILEKTVLSSRRAIIGQYPTPLRLAELLTKITIINTTDICIDPCCGTGTVPKQIIKYKINNGNTIISAYESTWASDKFSFPLQVTNISLTTPESINIPCRIIQKNVFSLEENSIEEIVNPENGEILHLEVPLFNAIVSNLPFVDFNTLQREDAKYMITIKEQVNAHTGIELSERNDTYVYIAFSLWKNLSPGGRIGIITSNSWLGTGAGRNFYNAIRWYYNIKNVLVSGNGIWFDNAKVVTTVLILEKKDISEPTNEPITFGLIKKSLDEWNDDDIFNAIVNSINVNAVPERYNSTLSLNSMTPDKIESILNFGYSINLLFYKPEWVLDIQDVICPLKSLFSIERGEKTGQDEIFYIKEPTLVNNNYIINGLKNTKQVDRLMALPDTYVFYCTKTREELNSYGDNVTISYLERFDGTLNKSVSIRGEDWHILRNVKPVKLFTGMNPFKRIFYGCFTEPTYINQRLIGLVEKDETIDIELCHALLNSILGIFFVESIGFGMGAGALDINKDSFERTYMLNPYLLTEENKENIKRAFEPLKQRDIKDTLEELNCDDRISFDHIVLEAYGIDRYYEDVKNTISSLQTSRLSVKR